MLSAAGHLQREQVIEEWSHTRPVSVLCQHPTVLSGLASLDVIGARAFVTGTSGHRTRGGVVRFRGAQPRAERLLRLLGVGRDQSFILEPGNDV